MPTTTNYGWTTPADTDLVKDGAAAIRTLGSSIDTTLKTQIDAQIPDSLLTTTGDVIYASGANTPARLGIGTTGQVLTVSGGVPSWATSASGGMTSIATGSLSSTTTTISSIAGTYTHLYLVINSAQVSVANSLAITLNGITSGYGRMYSETASASWTGNGGLGSITFTGQSVPATSNTNQATVLIENYANANFKNVTGRYGLNGNGLVIFGNSSVTAAVTSIGITTAAGTATFSAGTYILYGVK